MSLVPCPFRSVGYLWYHAPLGVRYSWYQVPSGGRGKVSGGRVSRGRVSGGPTPPPCRPQPQSVRILLECFLAVNCNHLT